MIQKFLEDAASVNSRLFLARFRDERDLYPTLELITAEFVELAEGVLEDLVPSDFDPEAQRSHGHIKTRVALSLLPVLLDSALK